MSDVLTSRQRAIQSMFLDGYKTLKPNLDEPKVGDIVDTMMGPMPVISSYGDKQAIEDGVLVPIETWDFRTPHKAPIMRMSRALFFALCPAGVREPREASAEDLEFVHDRLKAVLPNLKDTAERGDESKNWLFAAPLHDSHDEVWCIDNGYGQFTIMFRSDY